MQQQRTFNASQNSILSLLLFGIAITGAGIFFGLIATTASPIVIGLGLALMGGVALLANPRIMIWMILALGLFTGAVISLAGPSFTKLSWGISLLGFLLWVPAIIKMIEVRRMPLFVWLALFFVMFSIFSTLINWYSVSEFASGFKRYFQAYGLLFALALLTFKPDDTRRWIKLVLIMALLQLPFALFELLVLVPMRGGLDSSSYATDVVAGTFGANIEGGSANAEMASFLIISFTFLLSRWRAGLIDTSRFVLLGLACLIPLGLGETKIVVVMLPLISLVLFRKGILKSPGKYILGMVAMALITIVIGYIYITFIDHSTFSDMLNETLRYNVEDQGYGNRYLNRTTVLTFWFAHQGWNDPIGFLFGHGLGSSYLGGSETLFPGHIAARYPNYGIGLTTASTLLWDMGVFGLGLFISIFVAAWIAANKLWEAASDKAVKADVLAIQAALALFLLYIIYRDSEVLILPFQIVMAAVLGYLGYLYKQEKFI